VTKDPADLSAFKTPTLRSVGISGPYFHDGSVAEPGAVPCATWHQAAGRMPARVRCWSTANFPIRRSDRLVAFLHTLTSEERFEPPKLP
jgi:cytochrome c peroxidase